VTLLFTLHLGGGMGRTPVVQKSTSGWKQRVSSFRRSEERN
jgi:hypothetical protein